MERVNGHWTNRSTESFVGRIGFDFVAQLDQVLEDEGLSRKDLARKLRLTKGRVSQVLNNPGNLSLGTIVEFARALGLKVSVVAYDDGDPDNKYGPVSSSIFQRCWYKQGRPVEVADIDGDWQSKASPSPSGDWQADFASNLYWEKNTSRVDLDNPDQVASTQQQRNH